MGSRTLLEKRYSWQASCPLAINPNLTSLSPRTAEDSPTLESPRETIILTYTMFRNIAPRFPLLITILATALCMIPLTAAQSGPQAALIPPCVVSRSSRSSPSRVVLILKIRVPKTNCYCIENLRPSSHCLRQLHARRPILPLRAPGRHLEQHLCLCAEEL